jgi:hypothetical protein
MDKWYVFHPAVWRGVETSNLLKLIRRRNEIGTLLWYDYSEDEKPGRPPRYLSGGRMRPVSESRYFTQFVRLRTTEEVLAAVEYETAARKFCDRFSIRYRP